MSLGVQRRSCLSFCGHFSPTRSLSVFSDKARAPKRAAGQIAEAMSQERVKSVILMFF